MPRAEGALKSATETTEAGNHQQCSAEEKKDNDSNEVRRTSSIALQEKESASDIEKMSVDSNTPTNNDKEDSSLPRKPKRLFKSAGFNKKKDATRSEGKKDVNKDTKASEREVNALVKQQRVNEDKKKDNSKENNVKCQSYKRHFFDDDHAYEDPNLVVNNLTSPTINDKSKSPSKVKEKIVTKRTMDERPASPSVKTGLSKSTESIKAAVKAVREKHPSIMSETSTPRTIFACLVALLLCLIVFLAFHFLLHSHAVLSVAVAILVFVLMFVLLGFLNGTRIKCLILLFLPSVRSCGGKFALYLLLCYFVLTGPLCNMVGNIKILRNSVKCTNNEQPGVINDTREIFQAANDCVTKVGITVGKANDSAEMRLSCTNKTCVSVKAKLLQSCEAGFQNIFPTVCTLSKALLCESSAIVPEGNVGICREKNFPEQYCREEFLKILALLEDDTGGGCCGFLEIFGMLSPLLFLLIFYESYSYEKKYRTYNDFHNFFLTGHFQVIDQSRSSCDREAVLPLRKVELRNHVRPSTLCHLTGKEKRQLWGSLKTFFVVLLIVLVIILADLYMFQMFDVEHIKSSTIQVFPENKSEHLLHMNKTNATNNTDINDVGGNEVKQMTIRKTNHSFKASVPTSHCLAIVDAPGLISKLVLPLILSILLLFILFDPVICRIQWYICSRLYHIREKERVFYLYNKILEDRVQLVENCRRRMKFYHREMRTLNSMEISRILVQQASWLSVIFKFFHINLRRCIICNDTEKADFRLCPGQDCSGVYCLTCSFDIDKRCLYCDTELKDSISSKQPEKQELSSKESLV